MTADRGIIIQSAASLLERAGFHARVGILDNRFVLTSTTAGAQLVFIPAEEESPESFADRAIRQIMSALG